MNSSVLSHSTPVTFDLFLASPLPADIALNPYSDQLKAYKDLRKMSAIENLERANRYLTQDPEWQCQAAFKERYYNFYDNVYATLQAKNSKQERAQDLKNIKLYEKIMTDIANSVRPLADQSLMNNKQKICNDIFNSISEQVRKNSHFFGENVDIDKAIEKLEDRKKYFLANKDAESCARTTYLTIKIMCKEEEQKIRNNLQKIDLNRQKICDDLSILSNADEVAAKLLQEEKEQKQLLKKGKSKTHLPHKKKLIKPAKKSLLNSSHQKTEKRTIFSMPLEVQVQGIDKSSFIKDLFNTSSFCAEHPRIQRWKTFDYSEIRQFVDRNHEGEEIYHYQNLDDLAIEEQKARHFLPGTERLLKNSQYRAIYTFPTDQGCGMLAQLFFNNQSHTGYIYFGINQDQVIFHKYFENECINDDKTNIYIDPVKNKIEENLDPTDWISNFDFNLDIFDDYTLKFTYSKQHHVYVFPINNHLLTQATQASTFSN